MSRFKAVLNSPPLLHLRLLSTMMATSPEPKSIALLLYTACSSHAKMPAFMLRCSFTRSGSLLGGGRMTMKQKSAPRPAGAAVVFAGAEPPQQHWLQQSSPLSPPLQVFELQSQLQPSHCFFAGAAVVVATAVVAASVVVAFVVAAFVVAAAVVAAVVGAAVVVAAVVALVDGGAEVVVATVVVVEGWGVLVLVEGLVPPGRYILQQYSAQQLPLLLLQTKALAQLQPQKVLHSDWPPSPSGMSLGPGSSVVVRGPRVVHCQVVEGSTDTAAVLAGVMPAQHWL
mmetsp:Transcript_44419/g.137855  ORF Transcript_44419/g.137855 Transcript_44419/m.137855 type:complete len:284 (+) Transcript_44419:599-1450(+)